MPPEGTHTPQSSPAVEPSLDRVQRWLQAVIVHPGSVEEGLAAPEATAEVPTTALEEVVLPSWSMSAAERVDVYHGMYLLRMAEALESDYPAVRHFLGEQAFEALVRDYVQRYPSRSYTLNRLGDHLPRFFLDEPTRPHAAFLHDLARAELAVTEAFDEEESKVLDAGALEAVPANAWLGARLRPIKALRLLALRHRVTSQLDAAKHGQPAPRPRRRSSFLVVHRRDYSVLRTELGAREHALLAALISGVPLGAAIAETARGLRESRRAETVFRWFRGWIAAGFFNAIEVGDGT